MTVTTATLSADRVYRYRLTRFIAPQAGHRPTVVFVMLNPSTADEVDDDHTVRCCRRIATDLDAHGLVIVNLYAYRTPSPAALVGALRSGVDVVGPDNDRHLADLPTDRVTIAAWGNRPTGLSPWAWNDRVHHVLDLVGPVHALGVTKSNEPRHPSRLPVTARPTPYT